MKAKLSVFITIIASTLILSSCTKYYNCECTAYTGVKTSYTVQAKTTVEANKNCDEKGNLGHCELK
jgi:hypothetical protein